MHTKPEPIGLTVSMSGHIQEPVISEIRLERGPTRSRIVIYRFVESVGKFVDERPIEIPESVADLLEAALTVDADTWWTDPRYHDPDGGIEGRWTDTATR